MAREHWQDQPEPEDFPAAPSFLMGVSYHLNEKELVPCRIVPRAS
jgi:hypothetical protein